MRFALALTVAVAGCGGVVTNVPDGPSALAPGMKRLATASNRPHHHGKHRPRRASLLSRSSRSLRRQPVAHILTVTGYCYTGSRNAAGQWPSVGTAAANAYPLGTRLDVEGYGVVTVEDRSAPGATDVDLYLGTDSGCEGRAIAWGRRILHVTEFPAGADARGRRHPGRRNTSRGPA